MEKSLAVQIERFHLDVRQAAEAVVFNTFPSKLLALHKLIRSTNLDIGSPSHNSNTGSTDATVYPPPTEDNLPSKKRKLSINSTDGNNIVVMHAQNNTQHARYPNLVLENKHVTHLHSIVKQECEELAAAIGKVQLWVTLAIPKIEDSNNFGVAIQHEILNELHRAQECAYNLRDCALLNHLARAKICSKLIKYPYVEDYTSALKEHDDKQTYFARQQLEDIRSLYATLTAITQKNVNQIRAPRSNNSSGTE